MIVELANPEDVSTLKDMITDSGQIRGIELLDTSIKDVTNKKETMVSKIDSVISLMKEVEHEEKAAKQAKTEAAHSYTDTMLKLHELKDMEQQVKKQNDMLAKETSVQKKLLSTEMDDLQLRATSLLDKGDRSLELLDKMSKSLKMRLTSAIMEKKLAITKKKVKEAFARGALAMQKICIEKVKEESDRLKQEAVEISKLQEFLKDREHLITVLHGEISDKCQDVKRLKEELDQVHPFGGMMSLSRKSSVSVSSCSSIGLFMKPREPQPEPADGDVPLKKGSGDFINNHVRSTNYKQSKSVTEADIKSQHEVADITRGIKKVKIKGKLQRNRMFAKNIGKVKITGKLHRNEMFANCMKKLKIKGKLHRNEMFAKGIKKVTIKRKLHGNQICAKNIRKLNLKGKRHGSQMCAKSTKKLKIKVKRHGRQMCARSIKNLKIKGKQHESQMCAKSIKKVNIKVKLHQNQLWPKRIKKVKITGKQYGRETYARSIKKLKIKGLQVV